MNQRKRNSYPHQLARPPDNAFDGKTLAVGNRIGNQMQFFSLQLYFLFSCVSKFLQLLADSLVLIPSIFHSTTGTTRPL